MGIGPFTTYAPPAVYVRTTAEPIVGQLLGGLRIPVLIGTGREALSQTDFEIVRGSSSAADTPIFGEDATGRYVLSGSPTNPTLGTANGVTNKFRVRNFPIVDGAGIGKSTYDPNKVSVTVNGSKAIVSAVDGPNGIVSLLVPVNPDDVVLCSYNFHRKDARTTDDVSSQVTKGQATLTAAKAQTYSITSGSNDKLEVYVNDSASPSVITLTAGATRSATDVANDINSAAVSGLTATTHADAEGLYHVRLVATGNLLIGSGSANGALGFNPGDFTNRKKTFRVFNGPIVDGSDGGITTTDPSKVVVLLNGSQVIAKAVDGAAQTVTLATAPAEGTTVTIQYYFNTFQDTFDYLPNSSISSVGNVGIAPGRRDYLNGPDFIVVNDGDKSTIHWGTSFQVTAGEKTGSVDFDSTQISGLLIDDKIFGTECTRFTDTVTNSVSTTKFVLPLKPTTGNGRDTPLGTTLFNTVTNGRIDLPTNRPDLVTVYVGKNWRDAKSRPNVTVLEVDSATNTVTLRDPVPADYKAFATFWYNRITDDTYTFSVVTAGPSGSGQYTITSSKTGAQLLGVKFGTKSGLSQTVQWPSGSESVTDAFHTGDGSPVSETVTVTFDSSLTPATHASFTNASAEPYDLYTASRIFGGVVVDGNAPVSTDLSSAFKAVLLGQPTSTSVSMVSTDRLLLKIDGVTLASVDVSSCTTLAQVATAINAAVDADAQSHADGSTSFSATSANNLASVLTYGTQGVLKIKGRNSKTSTNGLASDVQVLVPSGAGETDAASKCGLSSNLRAEGSYNALNQPAELVGTKVETFAITAGVNDSVQLSVDGLDFSTVLPSGSAVDVDDVVTAINDAYMSVASSTDVATYTADLVALVNELKSDYNTHRTSTVFHVAADSTNVVASSNATDLATAITLVNEIKVDFNAHLTQSGVHQSDDLVDAVTVADATTLQTAVTLAHALKDAYNAHLVNLGTHGHDDSANPTTAAAATDQGTSNTLLNELKADFNLHRSQSGSHLSSDTAIATADATDLASSVTLANALKAKFNTHFASASFHPVADPTVITTADASDLTTVEALANALKAAYNAHRTATSGGYHVHGLNDTTNITTAALTELVAKTGAGLNAKKLVLSSRINTAASQVTFKLTSTAADVLGFTLGASAGRRQPTASFLASALNANSSFAALAVAYPLTAPGLGNFLRIDSLSAGATSTLAFSSVSNTALIPDTGLGIVPGTSGDAGEAAASGFSVTSSAGASGSSGTGFPGQTFTASKTGLRFTVLPASAGDYTSTGSFTLLVGSTFTADASIPVRAVAGVETSVFNTLNTNPGTTGLLSTFIRSGNEPRLGDPYYISYEFAKTDLSTGLFRDLKKIQANFGAPTADNPLSLAARLALLNGAVLVGLKQVNRAAGSSQASSASFMAAIEEQRKPMQGNVKPDVIVPLATDPNIFAYLNQHCAFMSSPRQEGERMGVVGCAVGTTALGVQAIAKGLASELMIVTYPDSYVLSVTDADGTSFDQLVDGSFMAASIAGTTCNPAIDVATPLTRRQVFGFKQVGRILEPTEANQIAVAGVSLVEQVDAGLRIRHGLTTRVDNVITRTPSVTLTVHYVQQTMRRVLDPFIGQKFSGAVLKQAESSMTAAFRSLIEEQIVGKVAGISITVDEEDPTIMRAEAVYVPVFPLEYIVASLGIRVRL